MSFDQRVKISDLLGHSVVKYSGATMFIASKQMHKPSVCTYGHTKAVELVKQRDTKVLKPVH